ncbi:S-adenosyl-L-methionine-dependent methyltransferase [Bombardia bombarda]|uniref:S-adenosyl-L-methionine-dependent methyltransferase n=1 Tax=Bombardia bombarda TaxID=252184 RepID=A0AA39WTZ9_9PEZI|nr:S-adenosyl-L-methionine-dependent methyltransferase [Bombardia bombarda]
MTAVVADKDDPSFWKLQNNIKPSYWDDYVATRPVYDSRIFQPILDYHASHSQSGSAAGGVSDASPDPATAALDIGTGSGSAIEPLTKSFHHVVASDNDPVSLAFAKRRFAHLPAASEKEGRLSYTLSSGEDLLMHHPPNSFNLVTCAETFPLMDTDTALDNIWALLRPGGTMAVWFYGPPFFTREQGGFDYQASQRILDALMDHNFRPVVSGGGEARTKVWKRAVDGKYSWLDYIPLPTTRWVDVRRHKWNTHARLSFFTPDACDFPVDGTASSVGEHETVTEEEDLGFWRVSWDVEKLARFVRASFPRPHDGEDETMERLFAQLADAMGGRGVERKMSWPVVLILASVKK